MTLQIITDYFVINQLNSIISHNSKLTGMLFFNNLS
jgi:hypothetical protein